MQESSIDVEANLEQISMQQVPELEQEDQGLYLERVVAYAMDLGYVPISIPLRNFSGVHSYINLVTPADENRKFSYATIDWYMQNGQTVFFLRQYDKSLDKEDVLDFIPQFAGTFNPYRTGYSRYLNIAKVGDIREYRILVPPDQIVQSDFLIEGESSNLLDVLMYAKEEGYNATSILQVWGYSDSGCICLGNGTDLKIITALLRPPETIYFQLNRPLRKLLGLRSLDRFIHKEYMDVRKALGIPPRIITKKCHS